MKIYRLFVAGPVLAAVAMTGCGGERPIEGRGTPPSITEKSNVSNPLNVVGIKGKSRLADRRPTAARRLGR